MTSRINRTEETLAARRAEIVWDGVAMAILLALGISAYSILTMPIESDTRPITQIYARSGQ